MDMTSYDRKGIFTGRLHLCHCAVATAVAFTADSTEMFAVITTSATWTVRGITCPFYVAASGAKEQEAVNFLEKK
eukprot:7234042-Ditylum_brightwellii.AAC.1